jgi:hypothetical protein
LNRCLAFPHVGDGGGAGLGITTSVLKNKTNRISLEVEGGGGSLAAKLPPKP